MQGGSLQWGNGRGMLRLSPSVVTVYVTSSSAVTKRPRDASVIEYFAKSLKVT